MTKYFNAEAWAYTSRKMLDFCSNLDAVEATLTMYDQPHDKTTIFAVMTNANYLSERVLSDFEEYAERIKMPEIIRTEERARFINSVPAGLLESLTPLRQFYFTTQRELLLTADDVEKRRSGYSVKPKKVEELKERHTHYFTEDEEQIIGKLKDSIEWMREKSPEGWNFTSIITYFLRSAWDGSCVESLDELPCMLIKSKRMSFTSYKDKEEAERIKRQALNAEINAVPVEPIVVDRANSIPVVYGSHLYGEHANDE